jgi:hypothetical protein
VSHSHSTDTQAQAEIMLILSIFQASFAETMFEYYFLLTYKGGSTVEVPAGRAAFIPKVFGDTSPTDGIIYDDPSLLRVDLPDERIVAQPRFVLKDFQQDLRGFDKVPACVSRYRARDSAEDDKGVHGMVAGRRVDDAGCEPLEQLFRGNVASDAGRA